MLCLCRLKLARPDKEENADRQKLHSRIRNFGNYCSQVGDSRPISSCEFSPDGKTLATASWSGLCKLWSIPECTLQKTLKGHTQRVSCITWHPEATLSQDTAAVNLATSDADGVVRLWNLESDAPLETLVGHSKRVPRLAFHPSGRYEHAVDPPACWLPLVFTVGFVGLLIVGILEPLVTTTHGACGTLSERKRSCIKKATRVPSIASRSTRTVRWPGPGGSMRMGEFGTFGPARTFSCCKVISRRSSGSISHPTGTHLHPTHLYPILQSFY